MDSIEIIIILLFVLAIAGVLAYYIYDYVNYKKDIASEITTTNNSLTQESTDRLGNLAYVVNQVNNVNTDIYNTVTSNINQTNINTQNLATLSSSNLIAFNNISTLNSSLNTANINLTNLNAYNSNLNSNLDNAFKFSSPSAQGLISFYNLPGANPNINLMNKLITTMGITANNLTPQTNNVQFCGATDGSGNLASGADCIKFPNANGDTYIAPLASNNSVILKGTVNIQPSGMPNVPLLNIPQPTSSGGGKASPAILVDAGGNLVVNTAIKIQSPSGANPITLSNDGTNLNISGGPVQINPTTAPTTATNSVGIKLDSSSPPKTVVRTP